ncbi:MAG: HAD family hydrolase [Pseudomonadales bacterium]
MRRIKVITFDLDNTLWSVNDVMLRAEAHMRDWLDEHVPDYYRKLSRERILALRTAAVAELPQLAHDVSGLRREVLYRGISEIGYSSAEARRLAEGAFGRFYEARQQVVLFDDALEVLDALAASYRLGALTNGNADTAAIGLNRFFSFAFNAADVGASKPAPHMFRAALRHARAQPDEGIHIGDHLVDDIQGAGEAGMHSIWMNPGAALREDHHHQPSREVRRLRELLGAVGSIEAG